MDVSVLVCNATDAPVWSASSSHKPAFLGSDQIKVGLAAVRDAELRCQQPQGFTAKLMEQPQTGRHALHAVVACAVLKWP